MPSRRPHTKTRHGCNTCKARKVRCDEEKPVCRNCTRGNRSCSYPSQILAIPNSLATHIDAQDQIFPIRDMELLHHYTSFTYKLMTNDPDQFEIWQVNVPQMAFRYRFLLHGILAVAALHRRYEAEDSQKETLMNLARYHQQHALTLYIPRLHSINQDNCNALFAFSMLLGILCFGMLDDQDLGSRAIISRFLDCFDALMGATAVAYEAAHWLRQGIFRPIMEEIWPEVHDFAHLKEGAREALESLLAQVESTCRSDPADPVQAYLASIYGWATVMYPAPGDRQVLIVVAWPVLAGATYVSLLKRRDPLALVILGHYGVALHLYGRLWMIEGLGKRLTEAIAEELDVAWRPLLAWPLSRVSEVITPE
ncbi:hypothetical protein DOTSEDRAFT_173450 [Dothistroma septosporum NZE10]|uniref:Zn(2)-C6 fungal-type domain-containing protein n=1 Tax=Dothistroma septosporum (strain NZE10 / CBS 128990) TaxID=675120 RepID=M2YLZ7_DOTSN|nr:hypothetical protein DOTSEDRAFT_173450 [Dothistroma septosporum NZE10]